MTFQHVRWTEGGVIVRDLDGRPRQITKLTIHLNEQDALDVEDYIKRFDLRNATIDTILSLIFKMGLREMKAQTDLDRFLDDQDKVPQ
jgi:hypothetical protein